MRRAALDHRQIQATRRHLGEAIGAIDMRLIARDFAENRHLLGFLESAQAERIAAGFGRDDEHRRVRPIRGGDGGHEVRDARPVLRDANAVLAAHARVAVRHVGGALLVHGRDKADSGGRKNIQRVHISRADDAEDIGHFVRDKGFDERFARSHFGHLIFLFVGGSCGRMRADYCAVLMTSRRLSKMRERSDSVAMSGGDTAMTSPAQRDNMLFSWKQRLNMS